MPSSTSPFFPPFTTEDFSPSPYPLKDQLKLQQTKGQEQPCTLSQAQAGGARSSLGTPAPRPLAASSTFKGNQGTEELWLAPILSKKALQAQQLSSSPCAREDLCS